MSSAVGADCGGVLKCDGDFLVFLMAAGASAIPRLDVSAVSGAVSVGFGNVSGGLRCLGGPVFFWVLCSVSWDLGVCGGRGGGRRRRVLGDGVQLAHMILLVGLACVKKSALLPNFSVVCEKGGMGKLWWLLSLVVGVSGGYGFPPASPLARASYYDNVLCQDNDTFQDNVSTWCCGGSTPPHQFPPFSTSQPKTPSFIYWSSLFLFSFSLVLQSSGDMRVGAGGGPLTAAQPWLSCEAAASCRSAARPSPVPLPVPSPAPHGARGLGARLDHGNGDAAALRPPAALPPVGPPPAPRCAVSPPWPRPAALGAVATRRWKHEKVEAVKRPMCQKVHWFGWVGPKNWFFGGNTFLLRSGSAGTLSRAAGSPKPFVFPFAAFVLFTHVSAVSNHRVWSCPRLAAGQVGVPTDACFVQVRPNGRGAAPSQTGREEFLPSEGFCHFARILTVRRQTHGPPRRSP